MATSAGSGTGSDVGTVEARTSAGRVRGVERDGVARYLGVPYAAPPVRFAAPEPARAWDGVRDATTPGPNAPQPTRDFGALDLGPVIGHGWRPGDDYLSVDVWTPGGADLPVMVFLHGGAFLAGEPGAPVYDGTALARAGVVLVSVTYRMGVEGFLPLPGGETNIGLRDQLAALAWVRENAAAFGGDPDRVTVFGESAGAMSIGCLLGSPLATGLFRRAIVQSGGAEMVRSLAPMRAFAERFAARLGTDAQADAVRAFPIADALAALDASMVPTERGDLREPDGIDPGYGLGVVCPVVGDDVLPVPPLEAVAGGSSVGVDVLAGANAEEMNLYLVPSGVRDALTEERATAGLAAVHPDAAALLAAGSGEVGDRYAAVLTDLVFRGPARRLVAAHRDAAGAGTATSSRGARRRSAGAWGPATPSTCPSSSARCPPRRAPTPWRARTRPRRSPPRCSPRGRASPPAATRAGRPTTAATRTGSAEPSRPAARSGCLPAHPRRAGELTARRRQGPSGPEASTPSTRVCQRPQRQRRYTTAPSLLTCREIANHTWSGAMASTVLSWPCASQPLRA